MYLYFEELDSLKTIAKNNLCFWEEAEIRDPNQCNVYVYWVAERTAVFLVTNITNTPIMEIGNINLKIVFLAEHTYNLSPEQIMLVEHHHSSNLSKQDVYFQVQVLKNESIRSEIDRDILIGLIRESV